MLEEIIQTAHLHYSRAKQTHDELVLLHPDADLFENSETVKTIDAFIYRFIKLQDYMGDKLFRHLLDRLGEDVERLPFIDLLHRMEKLGLLDSAQWLTFRETRNKLTHEYPNRQEEIINGILKALEAFREIEQILSRIESYAQAKGVLNAS